MPSINDKIKQYNNVNNIGSKPSGKQISDTQNTAIGNIRGTIKASQRYSVPADERMSASLVTGKGRGRATGSLEGYMHAPSTYLAMNDTGYLAKANQKARYSNKSAMVGNFDPKYLQNHKSSVATNVMDYRMTGSKGNSACKLHDIMKMNKLF